MLYKFKSKATGDLILLEPQGRQFLSLIGKAVEPKGIIEADQMPEAIKALHAEESTLKDWDASHGPTNEIVATGIAGIWAAVPKIQIDIVSIFECGAEQSCVAQIKVVVDEYTSLNVCDVFTFDGAGKVVSIVAYKA